MDSPLSPVPPVSGLTSLDTWDARTVTHWLESLGLGHHARAFTEHGVTGPVLPLVDDQALGDMGVRSVGHRIALLNALYALKKQHGIPIRPEDYVPASIARNPTASANASASATATAGRGLASTTSPGSAAAASEPWTGSEDPRITALEVQVASLSAAFKSLQRLVPSSTPAPSAAPCSTCGRYSCACSSVLSSSTGTPVLAPAGQAGQPTPRRRKPPTFPNHPPVSPVSPASPPHSASSAPSGPLHMPTSTPASASSAQIHGTPVSESHSLAPRTASVGSIHVPVSQVGVLNKEGREKAFETGQEKDFFKDQDMDVPKAQGRDQLKDRGNNPNRAHEEGQVHSDDTHQDKDLQQVQGQDVEQRHGQALGRNRDKGPDKDLDFSKAKDEALDKKKDQVATDDGHTAPATLGRSSTVTLSNDTPELTSKLEPGTSSTDRNAHPSNALSSSNGRGYKSFRVTMEDPTDKVLPAALKKYKIVDDWKLYVLFICYSSVPGANGAGDQERCMSLGERPLLLFQKLREQQQNPVFMLRHIRDVKSPEAIARGKILAAQTARVQQANGTKKSVQADAEAPPPADASNAPIDSSSSFLTTADEVPAPLPPPVIRSRVAAQREWLIASRSGLNPPINTDEYNVGSWAGPNPPPERTESARLVGPGVTLSPLSTPTYAVAIYPYSKERVDEMDVSVGDSYLVLFEAKGWWIVQGDPLADGNGAYDYDTQHTPVQSLPGPSEVGQDLPLVRTTGWVPAGCLLQMDRPLLSPGASVQELQRAVTLPISPAHILSTSTPGIMLTTYDAQAFAQAAETPSKSSLTGDQNEAWILPKDTHLRVFKRYNHWSYCVQETGSFSRGWVPSWFIGKGASKSRSRGNATSAAAPGHPHTPNAPLIAAAGPMTSTAGEKES